MCTSGHQFGSMHRKTIVRSLLWGRLAVVAYEDGTVTVRTPLERERRLNLACQPSVLLTMIGPDAEDLLLVGDGHGRIHVIELATVALRGRMDFGRGNIRAMAACPTEHGDVVVGTGQGHVFLLKLGSENVVDLAALDGPVSILKPEEGSLCATVRGVQVRMMWNGEVLARVEPAEVTRRFPRHRNTLIAGYDAGSFLAA